MAWAEINGIKMYYESHGEGDPIVFAHGAGGNHLSWFQQVPHFRKTHRCITFDHRGFGQTADAPNGPGMNAYAEDLRALLDHLGIEKATFVAQSMGGYTCIGFAVEYPTRTRALVMADTTGTMTEPELDRMRAEYRDSQPQPFTLVGRAYNPTLKDRNPAMAFLYDSVMALNPPRPQPSGERDERFTATVARLQAMNVPTLFIAGENDAIVPPAIIRHAVTLVPGAKYAEVPVSGHSVYFEEPCRFQRDRGGVPRQRALTYDGDCHAIHD